MSKRWSSFGDDQRVMNDWRDYLDGPWNDTGGWYNLLKEEYEKLAIESGDTYLLEEGVWEKIKYYMGKAGSLEKGGKFSWDFFGSSKKQRVAREKIQAAMDAASNKAIKQLDKELRDKFPKFPNMEKQEDWVAALLNIGHAYDSLVQASETWDAEDPQAEGTLDCKSANTLIDLLRDYTRHQLDYELADVYKHFKEELDREINKPLSARLYEADPPRGTLKHGADSAEDFMTCS